MADEGPTVASGSGSRRKNIIMIGALVGVMAAEALVVFILVKNFAGTSPGDAQAQGPGALNPEEGQKAPAEVEIKIADIRAQNQKGQQVQLLDFVVYATVPESQKADFESVVTAKSAKVQDGFNRVVRTMDPERFEEPPLTTLRAQLKEELVQVVGKDFDVGEVLFTKFERYPDR